jgi:hypothetical protein
VPASAATFTLALSAPSTVSVSQTFVITGSGVDPTDQGALYFELDSIPTSVSTTCPSGYLNASQLAASSGGSLIAFDQPETFDSAGNFSNQNATMSSTAGQFLLCGYTDDGAGDTLATASATVTVGSASPSSGQPSKPQNTTRPHISRSGKTLTCHSGAWSNHPTSFAYRWLVNGKRKRGARGRALAVTRKLRGDTVQCSVTASNAAGSGTATSPPYHVH